jgi:hypothetical protein
LGTFLKLSVVTAKRSARLKEKLASCKFRSQHRNSCQPVPRVKYPPLTLVRIARASCFIRRRLHTSKLMFRTYTAFRGLASRLALTLVSFAIPRQPPSFRRQKYFICPSPCPPIRDSGNRLLRALLSAFTPQG